MGKCVAPFKIRLPVVVYMYVYTHIDVSFCCMMTLFRLNDAVTEEAAVKTAPVQKPRRSSRPPRAKVSKINYDEGNTADDLDSEDAAMSAPTAANTVIEPEINKPGTDKPKQQQRGRKKKATSQAAAADRASEGKTSAAPSKRKRAAKPHRQSESVKEVTFCLF